MAATVLITVGGVTVTPGQAASALQVLRSSRGMMVRQPLAKAHHPLARCDYHQVAAPYRCGLELPMAGRGAAGRHLTKTAFCLALEDIIRDAAMGLPFAGLIADAAIAFATDHTYGVAIARAAVAVLEARRRAAGRLELAA